MSTAEPIERWVRFFKALGDENRLKIVGLLAHKPHSVEELAANLGVTSATISHHLSKLQQADLVEARVQQYYNVYALRADVFREMARQLDAADFAHHAAPLLDLDTYANSVLDEYLVRGKLKELPTQIKKREVILRRIAQEFEPDKRYTEKRVNEILKSFYTDVDRIRRELVKVKLLKHENGFYWKITSCTGPQKLDTQMGSQTS